MRKRLFSQSMLAEMALPGGTCSRKVAVSMKASMLWNGRTEAKPSALAKFFDLHGYRRRADRLRLRFNENCCRGHVRFPSLLLAAQVFPPTLSKCLPRAMPMPRWLPPFSTTANTPSAI